MASPETGRTSETIASVEAVGMNWRYSSAWNEVNARIAQRQNAVAIFVSLATAIVAVLFTSARSQPGLQLDPNTFSVLMPVISLVFGALNYKHDKTIALLRTYLAECEDMHPELKLHGYNNCKRFMSIANETRRWHDISCAVLITVFNGLSLWVAYRSFPDAFRLTGLLLTAYVVGWLGSLGLVMRSTVAKHVFSDRPSSPPVSKGQSAGEESTV
jgi:hypothetical protein